MEKFILSLDQGTTSSRAILFDKNGNTKSVVQREFKQLYPKSGWVEHDPEEIWTTQYMVAKECIVRAGLQDDQIESIGKEQLKMKLFESDLEPLLRFFHDSDIKPSGWVRIPKHSFKINKDMSSTQINV